MACEVDMGEWVFKDIDTPGVNVPYPFRHTPLHDLEPLVWMVIWSMDARPLLGATVLSDVQSQHYINFFRVDPSPKKLNYLLLKSMVSKWILALPPALHELQGPFLLLVDHIRQAHVQAEAKIHLGSLVEEAFADRNAPRKMVACLNNLRLKEDVLFGQPASNLPSSRKRSRSPGDTGGPSGTRSRAE
jgi:hypothetical protein